MKPLPLIAAGAALLGLAACGHSDDAAKTEKSTSINIKSDDDGGTVKVDANSDTGNVELKLPGGMEAKIKLPGGIPGSAKFNIDGVGLYPGARISTINFNASDKAGAKQSHVLLGFSAPADAAVVADWYQQQFTDKKIAASRNGDSFTGTTEDNDNFVLALVQDSAGKAKGTLTITDKD